MTDSLTAKTTAIGAFALSLVNLLAAFGLTLPVLASAPAIAIMNTAALAVAGAIAALKHLVEARHAVP